MNQENQMIDMKNYHKNLKRYHLSMYGLIICIAALFALVGAI